VRSHLGKVCKTVDKIQLSLYELSGYLMPGSLLVLALAIFYWAIWLPNVPFPIYKFHPDAVGWSVIGVIAYLLGHCVQSIGNKMIAGAEDAALAKGGSVPNPIVKCAREQVAEITGVKGDELDPSTLFRLADEISVQSGAVADRDIFVAREGFYKGGTIALGLLSLALIVRALKGITGVRFPGYVYYVSEMQLLFISAVTASAASFFRRRARRFGAYRVSRAIFAVVVNNASGRSKLKANA
jgi:hypothetical protein